MKRRGDRLAWKQETKVWIEKTGNPVRRPDGVGIGDHFRAFQNQRAEVAAGRGQCKGGIHVIGFGGAQRS